MTEDARSAAARYRAEKAARERGEEPESETGQGGPPRTWTAADRAAVVETAIQQAIRQGEFDDLPGAGKPIPGLGTTHDSDWWIRRKIETEQLRGLGPPALMLRVENAELDDRLDALAREEDVRDALEDFNRRVIEARRQLQGGPPVVTPTRDIDAEIAAWHGRRKERSAALAAEQERTVGEAPKRRRFRRSR